MKQQESTLDLLRSAYPGQINLSYEDVAKILNVAITTLYVRKARGLIALETVPGTKRFDIRDVADFVDAMRKPKKRRGPKTKLDKAQIAAQGGAQ